MLVLYLALFRTSEKLQCRKFRRDSLSCILPSSRTVKNLEKIERFKNGPANLFSHLSCKHILYFQQSATKFFFTKINSFSYTHSAPCSLAVAVHGYKHSMLLFFHTSRVSQTCAGKWFLKIAGQACAGIHRWRGHCLSSWKGQMKEIKIYKFISFIPMCQGGQQEVDRSIASWKFGGQAWFWVAAFLSSTLPTHWSPLHSNLQKVSWLSGQENQELWGWRQGEGRKVQNACSWPKPHGCANLVLSSVYLSV